MYRSLLVRLVKAANIPDCAYHLERFLPLLPWRRPALLAGDCFLLRLFLAMFLYLGASQEASRVLPPGRGCLPLASWSFALPSAVRLITWPCAILASGVVGVAASAALLPSTYSVCLPSSPWPCARFASGLIAEIAAAAMLSVCSAYLPIFPVGRVDTTGVSMWIEAIGVHITVDYCGRCH